MQDATDMVHVYDIVARQVRCELSLEAPVFCFHIIVQTATVLMLTILHSVKNGDPLRAAKIFMRKMMDHTTVSTTKASRVTL